MKKKNATTPLTCDDCGKVCHGIQGIRGHRRSCPGRQPAALNQVRAPQEPLVEPDGPLVPFSKQQVTLGSRLDIQGAETALRIYEPVRALREDLRDSLSIRRLSDPVARANGWPTYDDWHNLGRDVVRLELAIERILQQAHVSRDEPWTLHQLAILIRDRWLSWRREEAYRTWKQHAARRDGGEQEPTIKDLDEVYLDFGIQNLEAAWTNVIERLRWLTAHTKATL